MVGKSGSCYESILPPKNSASYLAALPHWKRKTIIFNGQTAPTSGLYEGRLAQLWPPLTLLEAEDYCEMTKQVI